MEKEKLFKAVYGEGEYDYFILSDNELNNYEKEQGYLSESTLFKIAFNDMVLSNNILKILNYDDIEEIISAYNEDEDCYEDEYQLFIVDFNYDEEQIQKMMEKSKNTLYYSNELGNYIIGVTDLGTSRDYVLTDIKIVEKGVMSE